jgi:D-alanyl-D-alanine carboxypeptidase/D-alanyl-D-alanine-endopeptidase (penicillin-binding protein 4)
VGLRIFNNDGHLYLFPSGDPTLLNKEFSYQPVFNYLKNSKVSNITIVDSVWREEPLGSGWSWNDYNDDYMAERSSMPVFGNILEISGTPSDLHFSPPFSLTYQYEGWLQLSSAYRELGTNRFNFKFNGNRKKTFYIPFATLKGETNKKMLSDTLHQKILPQDDFVPVLPGDPKVITIHSQPSDSLFKPMMHRSDNFFAEQTLLMASNEHLGYMSDEKIIDTILNSDLKDVPQRPKWVDGSGLSRYNLFTPQSFVYILNKMKNEFGWERIKNILPTGGTGTLSSYYKKDSGYIYAKTGTLSNNCALSGVLITKKGKLLIFSVLANNYITGATPVRKAVEQFLLAIRENY